MKEGIDLEHSMAIFAVSIAICAVKSKMKAQQKSCMLWVFRGNI